MSDCKEGELQLSSLVSRFYSDPAELGWFTQQEPEQLPPVYRALLDHSAHMTVTVEQHHAQPVVVQVLSEMTIGNIYQRRILLRRVHDDGVVQFGIVSVKLDCLPEHIRELVISGGTPLGRILIENQVLREVQLCSLWKVVCGPDLAELLAIPEGAITYGRTARILVDSEPAIELLEIVNREP